MSRRSKPSATSLAQVRHYFGLDQAALAAYLGVGAGMVGHIEAGRKVASSTVVLRLHPLAIVLPIANPGAPPATAEAAHLAPPNLAPLAARLAYCQHHARKLRRELSTLTEKLEYARRWQQALPALLAQADERARPWLLRRQEQAAAALDGEAAAHYHLLRLRLDALDTEAATLTKLLGNDKENS